jgi:2-polyprenyl-6-methoxyphenol hydroxylase-like FAD-dependent oxidoreductase
VRRRALVIGGSIAGLLAANALRSIGWDAVVCERAPSDLQGRGAGLGTHRELVTLLARLGLAADRTIGTEIATRICLDRGGRITHRLPMPQRMTSWPRMYHLLKHALPAGCYRHAMELVRVEQDSDTVTAVFANGRRERGALLVAADGVRSTVRAQLAPQVQPHYAGYIAWRGLLDEAALPAAIREEIFEHYAFCLPPGEILLSYPVPGRDNAIVPGQRGYNHIWYRPLALDALHALCTDAAGACHGVSIAPPLIRPEVIAGMRGCAHALLAPQLATLIDLTAQPFFQAIFDLESAQLAFGRIALLGDAAFVARPHVGMGVTKAALDAECLIDALAACDHDVATALAQYQARQRPFGAALVAQARRMGAALEQATGQPWRDPEAVMRSIGSPLVDLERLRA